jgi:hypothetical protein
MVPNIPPSSVTLALLRFRRDSATGRKTTVRTRGVDSSKSQVGVNVLPSCAGQRDPLDGSYNAEVPGSIPGAPTSEVAGHGRLCELEMGPDHSQIPHRFRLEIVKCRPGASLGLKQVSLQTV